MSLKVYDVRFDVGLKGGNYGLAYVLARSQRGAKKVFEAANHGYHADAAYLMFNLLGKASREAEPQVLFRGTLR